MRVILLITLESTALLGPWLGSVAFSVQAELARCRERAQSAANAAERVISDKRPPTQTEPCLSWPLSFLLRFDFKAACKTNQTIVHSSNE